MQGTVIERQQSAFVGIRVTGTFDTLPDLVPSARNELLRRQFVIEGIVDPNSQLGITKPDELEASENDVTTYLGFEVEPGRSAPQDMKRLELAPGKYARFEWVGSLLSEGFENFYPEIFGWFMEKSLSPSPRAPWIEVYGADYDWHDKSNIANKLTVLMPIAEDVPVA